MEGTCPHCLCVRSVLARIRPLYTYIDIVHTHARAHTSFTRVYLSWRVVAFILVAVSSDGRLFNAIIRRSIVSQPFFHPLLPPPASSIFSTLGLVRHCFFSAVSIRGVYTSVPTDRYGMKSGRRRDEEEEEEEGEFDWPLFSLWRERGDSSFSLSGIYEPRPPINR